LPFKCNLQRYNAARAVPETAEAMVGYAVGLYKLNAAGV
jgi:hypothetical protein